MGKFNQVGYIKLRYATSQPIYLQIIFTFQTPTGSYSEDGISSFLVVKRPAGGRG